LGKDIKRLTETIKPPFPAALIRENMKKFLLFAGLFLIILATLATPALARNMIILVFPIDNTWSKDYSWISAGMTETVISDLAKISQISVISNEDRKRIMDETKFALSGLVEEDTKLKIGKLVGANVLLTGSYFIIANKIRINARLINVETGKIENTVKLDGALDAILELQDKVVMALIFDTEKMVLPTMALVKNAESEKQRILDKPKPKFEAFELYSRGLETQDVKPSEALVYYDKALDLEPNYTNALVSAGLTAALIESNEDIPYLEKAEKIYRDRNETASPDYALLVTKMGYVYDGKRQPDQALAFR